MIEKYKFTISSSVNNNITKVITAEDASFSQFAKELKKAARELRFSKNSITIKFSIDDSKKDK